MPAIRKRFPKARIVVRADSGFSRESILAWCEAQEEDLIGMARNTRFEEMVAPALQRAMERHCMSGVACREFVGREYSTLESWSRSRRMLCKAGVLAGMKANPRFVPPNIPAKGIRDAEGKVLVSGAVDELYEKVYCARGNAENRIKQRGLDLKSDRTPSPWMESNQMRLWFSSLAYLRLDRVRQIGLQGTACAKATLGTLRLRVLKVAVYVRVGVRRVGVRRVGVRRVGVRRVGVRRVHVALCSAFPLQGVFRQAARRLGQSGPSLT